MDNISISIVIPLYNAELYINQCLASIKNQTFTNWEAIIIDDGSKDKSLDICRKHIANDQRFKLISKQNEGASTTRNKGILLAKGDFIFFLDADDYLLDKNCLEILTNLAQTNNVDFIRFEYKAIDSHDHYLFNNKNKYLRKKFYYKIVTPTEYCEKIAHNEFLLCFSFFKSSILKKQKIQFINGCRMREDADFIIRYLYYCKKAMYIPDEFYAYRKHNNAATSINPKNYESDLKLVFDSLNTFKDKCHNCEYKKYIYKFLSILATEQRYSIYAKYYFQIVNKFPVKSIRYKLSKYRFIEKIYLFILDTLRKINICTNMILK